MWIFIWNFRNTHFIESCEVIKPTSWSKPTLWGFHMAHLGSTSLFGLYLAMGGVLACIQRQCMLGWGEVTIKPSSLLAAFFSLARELEILEEGRSWKFQHVHFSVMVKTRANFVPVYIHAVVICIRIYYTQRGPALLNKCSLSSHFECLFTVSFCRLSTWTTVALFQRGVGTTVNCLSPVEPLVWSTQTWKQLKRWCAWARGARASSWAPTGQAPASPDPSPQLQTPVTPSCRQKFQKSQRTLCLFPPW